MKEDNRLKGKATESLKCTVLIIRSNHQAEGLRKFLAFLTGWVTLKVTLNQSKFRYQNCFIGKT